jgi:hypothetical protein
MKKIIGYLSFTALILACGKDRIVDITPLVDLSSGIIIDIPFDSNTLELNTNQTGLNTKATYCPNRKNIANKAIHFNRLDSAQINFFDLENASFVNGIFCVSCWVLLEDTTLPCAILSKRSASGGFEYSLDNHFKSKEYFNFDNWIENGTNTVYGIDPLNASAAIDLNQWQHLVYVADGTSLKVYVNGVLQTGTDLKNSGQSFTNTDKPFVVGNGGGYGKNYYFQGAIDDLKMYNRILNTDEIKALYVQ